MTHAHPMPALAFILALIAPSAGDPNTTAAGAGPLTPERIEIEAPDIAREYAYRPEVAAAVKRELWYQGRLRYGLRRHGQRRAWDFVEAGQAKSPTPHPYVLEFHRRLGKSHLILMRMVARCLSRPEQRCLYGLPTERDALRIVIPNLARVLEDCPPELRPRKAGMTWYFENPAWGEAGKLSELSVIGINHNPEGGRGAGVDEACVDEAGYCEHLEHWLRNVVGPQFIGRHKPTLVLISTPPKTMDHPFIKTYIPLARSCGRYLKIPCSENDDFGEEDREICRIAVGREDSIAWRREMLCEHVTDPSAMIVPEWLDAEAELTREVERPVFFQPESAGDLGWEDYAHILFGYVDFRRQTLVVEDEIWRHYTTPGDLARMWREKEEALYAGAPPEGPWENRFRVPYLRNMLRLVDAPALTVAGLTHDHGLEVFAAAKHDRDATIAELRSVVQERRVVIHPRCEQLLYQLKNGIWDEKRRDWVRSSELGHCDGIAALGYMVRQARWRENPQPPRKVRYAEEETFLRLDDDDVPDHPIARLWRGG